MTERRAGGRIAFILVTVVALVGCASQASPGTTSGGSAAETPVGTPPASPPIVPGTSSASPSAADASTAPSAPAVLGDILFTIKAGGVGGSDLIWATTADGSRPLRQIGPHGWWPDLSPDGRSIAYTGSVGPDHFDIWTMHADGSGVARVTGNDFNGFRPVWSPDGTKILFTGFDEGLLVVNKDGSGQKKLADGNMGTWSPDGMRIAYGGGTTSDDIYVMNADASKPLDLTNTPGNDDLPAWSPDGKQIAFSSDRSGNGDIYVMSSDGSKLVRLTSDADVEGWPAWSPDGRFIAYERRATPDALGDIWVMNADGSNTRDLTNDPANEDNGPSWQ
ncbi:MAG TPA: hypothetical protein VID95_12515 [Candidatus Limnocylindrales bacterium]